MYRTDNKLNMSWCLQIWKIVLETGTYFMLMNQAPKSGSHFTAVMNSNEFDFAVKSSAI